MPGGWGGGLQDCFTKIVFFWFFEFSQCFFGVEALCHLFFLVFAWFLTSAGALGAGGVWA